MGNVQWEMGNVEWEMLAPLPRIRTPSHPLFDDHADNEEHDHLSETDEAVDRETREGAWLGPADRSRVETGLRYAIQLDGLAHDEADRRAEDDRGPDDAAEDFVTQTPERVRDEQGREGREGRREGDPVPVELVHAVVDPMVGREAPARQSVRLQPIELPLRHADLEVTPRRVRING